MLTVCHEVLGGGCARGAHFPRGLLIKEQRLAFRPRQLIYTTSRESKRSNTKACMDLFPERSGRSR